MKSICLFSDGSCLGNPGAGGWAYILRYQNHQKEASGGETYTTNNKMELKAVIEGLKAIKEPCKISLYSDSNYVVKGINEWLNGWVMKNFKNVKNQDLWSEYLKYSKDHKITAFWVKGHDGHPENERCDELARAQAERINGC